MFFRTAVSKLLMYIFCFVNCITLSYKKLSLDFDNSLLIGFKSLFTEKIWRNFGF